MQKSRRAEEQEHQSEESQEQENIGKHVQREEPEEEKGKNFVSGCWI